MKRKFLVLACVAALLCSLAACSLTQAQSISFARQPQSVFVVGDRVDINDLIEVNVVLTDGTTRNDVPATVRGFDTNTVGVFTATVSYRGASIEFTYYVVESLDGEFIGGSGTEEDPYLIASAEQFKNIAKYPSASYELVADIDFGGETVGLYKGLITTFSGVLDGAGRTIKGLRTETKEGYLFQNIRSATLKNFVFELDSPVAIACNSYGTSLLEGITVNGSKVTSEINHGNFVLMQVSGTLTMKDCTNNASMRNTSSWCGLFLGGYVESSAKIEFVNCVNNGTIEGQSVGAFIGNSSNYSKGAEYSFTNCVNNGKIVGTVRAGVVGAGEIAIENDLQKTIGGTYIVVDSVDQLISFDGEGRLMLNIDNLTEDYAGVASFKVQMQFRTASPTGTNTFEVIRTFRRESGSIDTGFRNWSVVSAWAGAENSNSKNLYSYPGETATEGGNYQYITIEKDGVSYTAYYFDFEDYYVISNNGWIKFTVFGYDANGNLICSSNMTNDQNTELQTVVND